jgi:hypothetical protein
VCFRFFEMMGTWSFGNYFKKEAIDWAFEILTTEYGIDPDRLYATYCEGDAHLGGTTEVDLETKQFWLQYLPEDRVRFRVLGFRRLFVVASFQREDVHAPPPPPLMASSILSPPFFPSFLLPFFPFQSLISYPPAVHRASKPQTTQALTPTIANALIPFISPR